MQAAKNLSLKLLDTKSPEQVMKIFESEFLNQDITRTIHSEEIILILKFFESAVRMSFDRDMGQ